MERPKLRHIDLFPVELSDRKMLFLHDPLRYGQDLIVAPALIEILRYFDGQHSLSEIQLKLMLRTGELIDTQLIEQITRQLDEHLLLDSDNFRQHRQQLERQFATVSVREAAHAGVSYPKQPEQLNQQLARFFAEGAGLPAEDAAAGRRVRAIIAPHIDLRCAGPCYSWAYRQLAEGAADCHTIIILGTSHYGTGGLFIIAEKDFATPLGRLEVDHEFIARLRAELGEPPRATLSADIGAHRLEHSIEFQLLFLQYLFRDRPRPRIVPILVTSFQPLIERVDDPLADPAFAAFTAALRRTIDQSPTPVSFVIGADLAHIGRKFGDEFAAQGRLAELEQLDLAMLQHIESGDTQGFYQFIKNEQDARRVCGFPPILTLLATMPPGQGKLLKYEQWSELATDSAVTYASLAFYESD